MFLNTLHSLLAAARAWLTKKIDPRMAPTLRTPDNANTPPHTTPTPRTPPATINLVPASQQVTRRTEIQTRNEK